MWGQLSVVESLSLSKDPALLVSVSTSNTQYQLLYSQARELSNFLLRKIGFKRIASFRSSSLPPEVGISESGVVDLVECAFYYYPGARDVLLFAGHSSPTSEEYEFARSILSYAQKLGVKEVVSVGARWAEAPISPLETPKVLGFATDEEGVRWLKENGVTPLSNETAFYFTNLIVALSPQYGMRGCKISVNHGEPRPHPKSLMALLTVLSKKLSINVEMSELVDQSKRLEEMIKRSGLEIGQPDLEEGELSEERERGGGEEEEQKHRDIYR